MPKPNKMYNFNIYMTYVLIFLQWIWLCDQVALISYMINKNARNVADFRIIHEIVIREYVNGVYTFRRRLECRSIPYNKIYSKLSAFYPFHVLEYTVSDDKVTIDIYIVNDPMPKFYTLTDHQLDIWKRHLFS
jgi:hypothetical protein